MWIDLGHLPPGPRINQLREAEASDAELRTIQEGLFLMPSMDWPPTRILFCTDSQSALATLAAGIQRTRNSQRML